MSHLCIFKKFEYEILLLFFLSNWNIQYASFWFHVLSFVVMGFVFSVVIVRSFGIRCDAMHNMQIDRIKWRKIKRGNKLWVTCIWELSWISAFWKMQYTLHNQLSNDIICTPIRIHCLATVFYYTVSLGVVIDALDAATLLCRQYIRNWHDLGISEYSFVNSMSSSLTLNRDVTKRILFRISETYRCTLT